MLGMSNEQLLGLLRQILPIVGAVAVSLGWMKPDEVGGFIATALSVAGALLIIVSAIWTLVTNARNALIKKADVIAKEQDSPLKALVMTNTREGREMAESLPGMTSVTAGTTEAAAVARAT